MHTIREITRLATMLAGLIAPRLRSPARIVARHAITLIVRLGTEYTIPCFWIIPMAWRRFEMACKWLSMWFSTSNASNSESLKIFFFSTGMPVLDIKITALEALKPLTTHYFTKSSLTASTWKHSMSLDRSFLQMKAENQNFPQMTRIWLENWHLRSRINL